MTPDVLHLWIDETPHEAALNMALDEAMLLAAEGLWMRVYRWAQPSLSMGFSQGLHLLPADKAHWPLVRRWTGGGVVVHDGDWTYTLATPRGSTLYEANATDTYRYIHDALLRAMDQVGLTGGELQPESTSDGMGVCFVEPARYDAVWQGRKIAGAAQRRTRIGFLHQGTVQEVPLPDHFGPIFAHKLAMNVIPEDSAEVLARLLPVAEELAAQKYSTPEWTLHRQAREQAHPQPPKS